MSRSKLLSPLDKATSNFMKKINMKDRTISKLITLMNWRTKLYRQHQDFIKHLVDNGRVSKEELAQHYPKIEKPKI